MAEVTGRDLAAARKAAGLHQYQVAHQLHVSEDVIGAWEREERDPHPDQVDEMEKLYKTPLWHGWMRYHFKSYRDRYPETVQDHSLALALINARYQMQDVVSLQDAVERDALDGKIDNRAQAQRYVQEMGEAIVALRTMMELLQREGGLNG